MNCGAEQRESWAQWLSDNTAAVPWGKPRDQLVLPVTARKPGADRGARCSQG